MNFNTIKNTLSKFNKDRLEWEDYFMSVAYLTSCRSPCNRLHVGCVLVKDKRVISVGYNGFISGHPHVSRVVNNHEQSTIHAEQNCLTDCVKRGICAKDAIAYITHYPCINCCKLLLSSNISKIIYDEDYKNDPIVDQLIKESGIEIKKFSK